MKFNELIKENIPSSNIAGILIGKKWYDLNISSLIRYIDKKQFKPSDVFIDSLPKQSGWGDIKSITIINPVNGKRIALSKLPKERQELELDKIKKDIMKTDLQYPIIILSDEEDIKIIDGHHRISKAKLLNMKKIPAYILNTVDVIDFYNSISSSNNC